MKLVKNFVFAVLLATVLAVSTPAGEMDIPGYAGPTPSPTPQGATSSDEADGAFYGGPDAAATSVETSDYLLYEALAALLSMY
jgi:hypothetical protein